MQNTITLFFLILLLTFGCKVTSIQNITNGSWRGAGYQYDINDMWEMKLSAKGEKFIIDYPGLQCGGKWQIISKADSQIVLKENITYGTDKCLNNGTIILKFENKKQMKFYYYWPNDSTLSAQGLLTKSK
jgi:hypothetical protein